jgi:hypothetical protein
MAFAALLALALSPLLATSALAQPGIEQRGETAAHAPADWSPPSTVYIPETGHALDRLFLDYWRNAGGYYAFGSPITPELQENGRTVQYFQYARFEYVPDDPTGAYVHLGNIGEELRPYVVLRSRGPFGGAASGEASLEAARMARAWLPVDKNVAERENTDTWQYVPETRHSIQLGFKAFWEQTGGASYLGNPLTEEYALDGVTYQVFERGQLAWKQGSDPWMVSVGSLLAKRYKLDTSPQAQGDLPTYSEDLFIPPPDPEPVKQASGGGEHWIEVNLSTQYLIAWEGDVPVMESYVSTGRPGFDTPAGTFSILYKVESENMEGVIGGEYYNVPEVPWTMYFTDVGHAIHGTYWHNNFGAVMSHGCVNLPLDVAEALYYWAAPGTRVEIHY